MIFTPAYLPSATSIEENSLFFIFQQDKLLMQTDSQIPTLVDITWLNTQQIPILRQQFFGYYGQQGCFAIEIAEELDLPSCVTAIKLRTLMATLDNELFSLAGRAVQIIAWDKNHQFCGRCGNKMTMMSHERVKRCPTCQLVNYPRIAPAIIVMITRGEEVLLSRAPHFAKGRYSVQAGFVEVGETLEETVHREVMEEVNIKIKNLRYFGSQPWPFPNSLMIAFTADYASGDLKVNLAELEAADWYSVKNLPQLPTTQSIANRMLQSFIMQQSQGKDE